MHQFASNFDMPLPILESRDIGRLLPIVRCLLTTSRKILNNLLSCLSAQVYRPYRRERKLA